MTEEEIDRLVAEWHDAPASSPIAGRELHEHLGMTWDEYRRWAEGKTPVTLCPSGEGAVCKTVYTGSIPV